MKFPPQQVIIAIPVYKEFKQLTSYELLSLKQLKAVLYKHHICFVAPVSLNVESYSEYFLGYDVSVQKFDDRFFQSVAGYNQLMLEKQFYIRFDRFQYLLIYQTDAFVFRDELLYWVRQGYDFIGAPFHTDNSEPFDMLKWTVGNGGFSLRKVSACIKLIDNLKWYFKIISFFNTIKIKKKVAKGLIKLGKWRFFYADGIMRNRYNEDYVFGVLAKKFIKDFNVAPLKEAIAFSFEAHPDVLFQINNSQLPFGCHGWNRYGKLFWKLILDKVGA